jgi:allophanate hydrolase
VCSISLDIVSLEETYRAGALTPTGVVKQIHERIAGRGEDGVWIHVVPLEVALERAAILEMGRNKGERRPLYGIPFAVKDNIDVAGLTTTAACPAFEYTAQEAASVVSLLLDAGAILIGKTNLDQFATGLVGVRSPYGICRNVFDPRYIAGGSSSGSAVAVAAGLASFALGTDTAGSGRVPAALNNIVGLKPTRGLIDAGGVVPACRSLDCVSVFALTCADAARIAVALRKPGGTDPYRRISVAQRFAFNAPIRIGVPRPEQLEFFGDADFKRLYEAAISRLKKIGGTVVEIDLEPFVQAGKLLYSGPWIAERFLSVGSFIAERPDAVLPVIAQIIGAGSRQSGVDVFRGLHALVTFKMEASRQWDLMDCLALPTTGTSYTVEAVEADPVVLNNNLGYYTSFANLLDLSAVAVPAGFDRRGLPFGISILGPAFADDALVRLAELFHQERGGRLGATGTMVTPSGRGTEPLPDHEVEIAVVGAHLRGEPLNAQLTDRGARLLRTLRTVPSYRLFALPDTIPPKPGLVLDPGFSGRGIEVEVWGMSFEKFGDFVAAISAPMVIGNVNLGDGTTVKGFMCEPYSLTGAVEITSYGGWRAYLKGAQNEPTSS